MPFRIGFRLPSTAPVSQTARAFSRTRTPQPPATTEQAGLAWGGIPRLTREIGPALTRELVLTCRPFDAEEARSIGFVNRVVPRAELESAVDELAEQLARKAPSVVAATKRQVHEALENVASTTGAWADAIMLGAALRDPDARAAAKQYLDARGH